LQPSLGRRFGEEYDPYTTHFLRIRRKVMFSRLVGGRYRQVADDGARTIQPAKTGWLKQVFAAIFGKRAD